MRRRLATAELHDAASEPTQRDAWIARLFRTEARYRINGNAKPRPNAFVFGDFERARFRH